MKKIMMFVVLVVGFSQVQAEKTDKKLCEEVLAASMYNKILEDTCGFNGGVAESFKALFNYGKCSSVVPSSRITWYAKEVDQDTKKRFYAHGKKNFCEENLGPYAQLVEEMK